MLKDIKKKSRIKDYKPGSIHVVWFVKLVVKKSRKGVEIGWSHFLRQNMKGFKETFICQDIHTWQLPGMEKRESEIERKK